MTTIVYRDGVLAADTQMTTGDLKAYGRKLIRVGEREAWVGLAGVLADCQKFVRHFSGEEEAEFSEEHDDFSALIMYDDGSVECVDPSGKAHKLEDDEFFAIGSGSGPALAAMHMGADARRAVEIALLVDVNSGGEVVVAKAGDTRLSKTNAKPRSRRRAKAAHRKG